MTVTTNTEWLLPELVEQSKFFRGGDDLVVSHRHAEEGDVFIDELTVDGKTYTYRNVFVPSGEIERKRYVKRFAKLAFYRTIASLLGQELPWGALTGIRPVKFAYNEGDRWREVMRDVMGVSDVKLDMVARILDQQRPFRNTREGDCDLFVGIPFCPTRCLYCSFVSSEIAKCDRVGEYVDSLVKEIRAAKPVIGRLRSVYIGGGTPVSLPIGQLSRIFDAIGDVGCEFTVEAGRPDCINREVLALLKERGVTRVCVNPQTFNDKTLALLGRKHTVKDVYDKYDLARSFGFSVNMDLIAGLPEETFGDFAFSVDEAVRLDPDNVTVHTLSLKKGSKLKELVERLPDGETEKMVDYSFSRLTSAGYEPYYMYRQKYMSANLENTGYTKPGKACVYNVDVMEEIADNFACGANAVTKKLFDGGERIERYGAPKDIATYIAKTDAIIGEKNKLFSDKI